MFPLQQYFKDHKLVLSIFFMVGLINSIACFLLPVSIGEFFTVFFHSSGSKGKLLKMFGIHLHTLSSFFIFFSSLLIIRTFSEFYEKYVSSKQGELLVKYYRERTFKIQLSWSSEDFRKKHFGNYLLRYSNDLKAINNYLSKGILDGGKSFIFLIIGFTMMLLLNWELGIFYIILLTFVMIFVFLIASKQMPLISNSRGKRSSFLAYVTKTFQRHRSMKEAESENVVMEKFLVKSDDLFYANMSNNRFESMLHSLLSFFQYLIIGMVLLAISFNEIFDVSSSTALVFVLIMLQMNGAMKRLLKVPAFINKGKISLNKINEVLNSDIASSESIVK